MTTTDIAVAETGTDLVARVASGSLSESEQVLLNRLVKLRQGQRGPSREQLALMVAEAQHLGLDPFAGQCYFIDFQGDGSSFQAYPHWSGLIKIAEDTGEYEGHDGPFFSADGDRWVEAWGESNPPRFAKVVVHRRGHRPTSAIARHDRCVKGSPIWKTAPEDMLAKCAFRLALRRAFPKEADRPLSPQQLKALHTIASSRGLSGEELRPTRLLEASEIVGRPVPSFTDLSAAEASEVIDTWIEDEEVDGSAGSGVWGSATEPAASDQAVEGAARSDESGAGDEGKVRPPSDVRPADGGRTPAEGRRPTPAPDSRSDARRVLDDTLAEAGRHGKAAMAMAIKRGVMAEAKAPTLDDLSDEQCEGLTAVLVERCLTGSAR